MPPLPTALLRRAAVPAAATTGAVLLAASAFGIARLDGRLAAATERATGGQRDELVRWARPPARDCPPPLRRPAPAPVF